MQFFLLYYCIMRFFVLFYFARGDTLDKILLGLRIKEARIEREYSIECLAEAVGLNKSTISRYERGEIENPKMPVIESIGNVLHVSPAWLIGKSEDKTFSPYGSISLIYTPNHIFAPLKNMRKSMRYSPEKVAYAIGISKDDYLAIENGYNTDCVTLAKIAMFYCCTTDYALSFDGILNEDETLGFLEKKLLPLQNIFGALCPDDQDRVIQFASELFEKNPN